jgi:hypothetical protein
MIFSLRPFLITFLVLLQFIAPLVHAHTSEKFSSQGVHIPGLEGYARSADSTQSTDTATALCEIISFCGNIDGQVVGVDTGFNRDIAIVMQRLSKIIADLAHDYYLPPHPAVFKTVISSFLTTLTTQAEPLLAQLTYFSHSPRAPPQA